MVKRSNKLNTAVINVKNLHVEKISGFSTLQKNDQSMLKAKKREDRNIPVEVEVD